MQTLLEKKWIPEVKKIAKKSIMIIDDDKKFLEEIKQMLILKGYTVEGVIDDGIAVLKTVNEMQPDIILLNINIKDKNKMKMNDELRGLPENTAIPIIVKTSSYTEKEFLTMFNSLNIKTVFIKSIHKNLNN